MKTNLVTISTKSYVVNRIKEIPATIFKMFADDLTKINILSYPDIFYTHLKMSTKIFEDDNIHFDMRRLCSIENGYL